MSRETHSKPSNRPSRMKVTSLPIFLAALLMISGCASLSLATSEFPTRAPIADVVIDVGATPNGVSLDAATEYIAPIMGSPHDPTPTPAPLPTLGAPLPPPTVVVALPPIDFEAARADAQSKGLDIAFPKVGFHTGPGGNATGLGEWMRDLNTAGIPFFLKSTDSAGPIYEAQLLMKANEAAGRFVDHTLVFRLTEPRYEAPFYDPALSPDEAAAISWHLNRDI